MSSGISNTLYASRRKELLALINQLRAVGAQNDLDLPRITVIGNQSAGKSSVVEAISGITVPRDAGTCTRCPMECRLLSTPGPWSCRISIRNEFDNAGQRLRDVFEKPFGGVITDKSDVELALRRAQFAVLNPEMSRSQILASSAEELKRLAAESTKSIPFSQNVVCVDLEGPDLTDLSFIDLPGLIQNAEPEVVKLVEDMVVSHIRGNCLILVAVPMTDDIENQKALRLASQEDKTGRRTIGVLTKPDMLGSGSTKAVGLWLDVLEGRRHALMHGYYCTRQPDDDERSNNITPTQARESEESFFRKTAPWSKSSNSGRFGTNNLVGTLSRLLVQIINDNLPKIRADTSEQLSHCRKELAAIPPPISDEPATYLLALVTSFCSDFNTFVTGTVDTAALLRSHRRSYGGLKKAIRCTSPNFVPFVAEQTMTDFNDCLDDEEDDPVANVSCTLKPSMNLTEIRKHIEHSITRELPNEVPSPAKVSLIVNFQQAWPAAVQECFELVEGATVKLIMDMVDTRFGRFNLLQSHIKSFIKALVEKHRESCQKVLEITLETERMPFTQNTHYYESTTEAWLAKYKAVRSGKATSEEADPAAKRRKVADADSSISKASDTAGNRKEGFAAFSFGAGSSGSQSIFGVPKPTEQRSSAFTFPPTNTSQSNLLNRATSMPTPATPSPATTPSLFAAASGTSSSQSGSTRIDTVVGALDEEALKEAMSALVRAGLPAISVTELLGKLQPPDEYEKELRVMAEVRGYFQVAYKRVIDDVPRSIDLLFVRALAKHLQPFLIQKFGMGTPTANERCASYLGEDPALVARREELLSRKKRLESANTELDEFSLRVSAT